VLEVRDYILRQLDAELARFVAAVASGSASSFDDYQALVGRIRGLGQARELILEGFRNHDTEEDDDGVGV
jgi:hypothetical protein